MRIISLLALLLLSPIFSFSQAPQGFNYQAIVRDSEGNVRANQGVQFQFRIQDLAGNAIYTEAHTIVTNKYGLADGIVIGKGSTVDDFSSVDWGNGTYYINVKVDGVDLGTSQLLSVPYALYALSAGTGAGGVDGVGIESTIDNGDGTFTLNYTDGTSFTTIDFTGASGQDGATGKSAYEFWLDQGNTGTESDFLLSLIGEKGEKGEKGDRGEKGDEAVITGGASSVVTENLDTSRVLVSNLAGKISVSGISSKELNYLDNTKSNIQNQIDDKQKLNSNLNYISTLTPNDGAIIVGNGTRYVTEIGATARSSLGLGTMATQNANSVLINGGSITGIADLPIPDGGTGASTAAQARINLNVDIAGTDNSTNVTLTSVSSNYLTISGQEITAGIVPIALGGTGATNATSARSTLGLGSIATQDSDDINITGGSITDITDIAIADGGTGASTASSARTNLGLGSIATQNSNNVSITGGSISGITDIAISDGGTGASTASGARTNLGLVIGTDIQAFGSNLDDISDLTVSDGNFIVGNGTKFITESGSTARNSLGLGSIATQNSNNISVTGGSITNITDLAVGDGGTGSSTASGARSNLGLAIGSDVQAYDAELAAVAGLTSAADKGIQFTGSGSAATYDLTSAGKALLDDANAAAQRSTLGVDEAGTDNSTNVTLANTNYLSISGQEITGGTVPVASGGTGATSASAARTALGVAIGSNVQAYDAELAAVAGLTSAADKGIQFTGSGSAATYDLTSAGKALLDDANAAAQLVTLGLSATAAELNILDGGTSATSTTVADADRLVLNDNGTMVQVAVTDLKTYVHTNTSINDLSDGTANTTNFSNSILLGQSSTGTLNSAEYNVGLGYGVFDALTSGDRNMGVGYNALNRVTGGSGNVAIGGQSLTAVTTGDRNVAIGRQSGRDVDDGELANGADLTTGDENTYLGAWTQPSAADVQNETVIGSESTGQGSNTVTIGNAAVTQVYLSQDKGATVFAGALDIIASAGITLENDETITNSTDGTVAINGDVSAGTGSAAGVFKSSGDFDVTLKTGNSTTGVITITDGANGNIAITPNGTGEVDISKVDIDGGAIDGTTIGTNSAVTDLRVDNIKVDGNTVSSTDANGNIAITPNGTGEVDISKVDIDGGAIDGTVIGANSAAAGTFTNITANGDITISGDTHTYSSANSTDPLFIIKNTTNDANSARLRLLKDKGAAGADNDIAGVIEFYADDDNQDNIKFAEISAQVADASNSSEGGKLSLGVATHDGETQYGVVLTDGNAEDEIDVTIGNGTASVTTISGDLTVTGNDITFGNSETISNGTDGTVAITATNTTVSGNLSGSGTISGFDANLNDQTGTTYTLTSSDNGKVVTLNNGSAITLTIAASLGDGFNCLIVQKGAGQVTLSAAGGVTIANRSSETKTAGQYATVSVINIGSDTYILSGDTGT